MIEKVRRKRKGTRHTRYGEAVYGGAIGISLAVPIKPDLKYIPRTRNADKHSEREKNVVQMAQSIGRRW